MPGAHCDTSVATGKRTARMTDQPSFHVFLAYAAENQDAVEALAHKLQDVAALVLVRHLA